MSAFGILKDCFSGRHTKKIRPAYAASSDSRVSSWTSTSKASPHAPKKTLTQTYLDLGQRSHGKRTLCGTCGLLYVNGQEEDEKDHVKFCRSVAAGLVCPGWRDQRLVWGQEGVDGRVIEVRPGDGAAPLTKMREVKRVMDQEMGFVPLREGDIVLKTTEKAFLYVHGRRVVGCVIAEKINVAHPVSGTIPSKEGSHVCGMQKRSRGSKVSGIADSLHGGEGEGPEERAPAASGQNEHTDSMQTATGKMAASTGGVLRHADKSRVGLSMLPQGVEYLHEKVEAAIGIKQVWVSQNMRRQGIGKRMLEVARARFFYGFVVPRGKVAFSQLSTAGYSFARAYVTPGKLLVYKN